MFSGVCEKMIWAYLERMIAIKNEFGLCNIGPCSELAAYRSKDNTNPSVSSGRYCNDHYKDFLTKGYTPNDFVPVEYYEMGN